MRLGNLFCCRQAEPEHRAAAVFRLHPQPPAMRLHDRAADGQPDPEPVRLGGDERLEQGRRHLGREPRPGIGRRSPRRKSAPSRAVATVRFRCGVSCIASTALRSRLIITCWIWILSMATGGRSLARSVRSRTLSSAAPVKPSATDSCTAALRSWTARSGSRLATKPRRRRMISPGARGLFGYAPRDVAHGRAVRAFVLARDLLEDAGIVQDRRERLVQLVGQRRAQLAGGGQARGMEQLLLQLADALLVRLVLGNVVNDCPGRCVGLRTGPRRRERYIAKVSCRPCAFRRPRAPIPMIRRSPVSR